MCCWRSALRSPKISIIAVQDRDLQMNSHFCGIPGIQDLGESDSELAEVGAEPSTAAGNVQRLWLYS